MDILRPYRTLAKAGAFAELEWPVSRRFRDRAPHAMRIYGKPGEYFVREDIAPVAASLTAGVPDRRKIACDTAAKFYGLG